jgi:hypothetical protein
MFSRDFYLKTVLRLVGFTSLLAIPCALMTFNTMADVHQTLGLGEMPRGPIVSYLARSTCAFYGLMGALMWLVSFDVVRYRPIIRFISVAFGLMGVFLCVVDFHCRMPIWWSLLEGPFDFAIGAVFFILSSPQKVVYK